MRLRGPHDIIRVLTNTHTRTPDIMIIRDPSRIFEYSDIRIIQGESEYEFLKSNIRIVKFVKYLIN